MREAVFAVPGDIDAPTGGYAYARRLLAMLPAEGVRVRHLALPGGFPHPDDAALAETRRLLAAVPAGDVLLVDGLACGTLPSDTLRVAAPIVALVHHPLGLETGLEPARRDALLASERAALAMARSVVATSPYTARLLSEDFGVARERIVVAEPGTEPAPRSRGTGEPVTLLAVGAVTPRKAFPLLVEALAGLRDLSWRLTIVGDGDRAPRERRRLTDSIAHQGLGDRIRLEGRTEEARLAALFDAADVLVSPSLFEGYGMALAEGLARGLPIVASTGGASAETVPDAAGLKVPPGDVAALRGALRRMIADPAERGRRAEAAWSAARSLPTWRDTAGRVAEALRRAAVPAAGA